MTVIISILLFIFFGLWAIKLALKSDGENPLYIVFLLAMGLFRPSGSLIAGFDLSSIWLLFNIVLLLIILFRNGINFSGIRIIIGIYFLYLLYGTVITMFQIGTTTSFEFSLRILLKQIYPLLTLMVTASLFRRYDYLHIVIPKVLIVAFIASLLIGPLAARLWPFTLYLSNFLYGGASFTDHLGIITSLSLVWWAATQKKRYMLLAIWFFVSTMISTHRTGLVAMAIGVSFFAVLRFGKMRALPLLIALYLCAMSALFLYPEMQDKMFKGQDKIDASYIISDPTSLDFNEINSSGRFPMWEDLMNRFWRPRPLTGSGFGAVQNFLYSKENTTGIIHPHSSYVKVLCDTGLIGLCMFILIHLSCMLRAFLIYNSQTNAEANLAAGFVLCAVPSLLFIMGFESAINCATSIMQYTYIFTGIAVGISSQNEEYAI